MVPQQQTPGANVPIYNELGELERYADITQTQAQAQAPEPEQEDEQTSPITTIGEDKVETVDLNGVAVTGTKDEIVKLAPIVLNQPVNQTQQALTTAQIAPLAVGQDALDEGFIKKPWVQQWPVLFEINDKVLNEMIILQKNLPELTFKNGNSNSIFYVTPASRLRLLLILKALKDVLPAVKQPLIFTRKDSGLSSDESQKEVYDLVTAEIAAMSAVEPSTQIQTPEAQPEEGKFVFKSPFTRYRRNPTTGRIEGYGKRGRGRPKRERDEEVIDESKKSKVQVPSSLSSLSLPVEVSSSPDILDLHKNDLVTSITVKRSPIPQFMEDLFESLSNGTWSQLKKKHGFDSFFHLAAVINDDILVEKNSNGINVAIYKPYESEEIKIPSKLLGKFTLGEMVDKVKADMGQDFFSYHPFENNCQNFMFRFLKNSKALTPQIAEFVSQPIEKLVKDLPAHFPPLVKAAADIYGVVQPLLNPNP
jgi:hypothetical protein